MTYQEAVRILEDYVKPTGFIPHEGFDDAIKLGIKAMNILIETETPIGQSHTTKLLER